MQGSPHGPPAWISLKRK